MTAGTSALPHAVSTAQQSSIPRRDQRSAIQPITGCRTTLPTISTPSALAAAASLMPWRSAAASMAGARLAKAPSEARSSRARSGAASRAQSSGGTLKARNESATTNGAQPADPTSVRRKGPVANPSERTLE
jgi:hypothetical protein